MTKRVHTIRKAFLIPLGIDTVLLCSLFVLSLLSGSTTERLVFAIFFFPSLYLFLECVFRRVTVDEEGLIIRRLGREKKAPWGSITHVGGISLHKKAYILLTTLKGFLIVSNAYDDFPGLAAEIVSNVDAARVEEDVRQFTGDPPSGMAHIAMAWVAAVFMVGILVIKIISFTA